MDFKIIDLNTYPRREHFAYFSSLQYPYVGITANVDVTELVSFARRHQYSFYLLFLHLAALSADEIPEFRRRIRKGTIVEYSECPTSHIELLEDGTYCYCPLRHHMPLDQYMQTAECARRQARERASIEDGEDAEQMYFISSLPWVHYTSLIQPVAGGEESNPRITWGKFEEDHAGRKQLPVSVLVHHGLVDGIQIGHFYQKLNDKIGELTAERLRDELEFEDKV